MPDSFDKSLSEITALNAQATAAGALSSGQIQLDSRWSARTTTSNNSNSCCQAELDLPESRQLLRIMLYGIGSDVVDLIFSMAKREVTFLSGTAAISRL
jgi:hypothetical protein